mmetsp:Transcript_6184/g.21188  ORF Transcript_6184/g.21188 Transcript_6184/m.21188 type:complete len:209 (+) Transcript_6184:187-813(+)
MRGAHAGHGAQPVGDADPDVPYRRVRGANGRRRGDPPLQVRPGQGRAPQREGDGSPGAQGVPQGRGIPNQGHGGHPGWGRPRGGRARAHLATRQDRARGQRLHRGGGAALHGPDSAPAHVPRRRAPGHPGADGPAGRVASGGERLLHPRGRKGAHHQRRPPEPLLAVGRGRRQDPRPSGAGRRREGGVPARGPRAPPALQGGVGGRGH